ncbi:phospholipase D-like domain-containing protein [Novosphingobium mangrovi (ex Huang et al. 2023)]|uniref:Phospholipase D n=1 Tax=Novosphingobium mangrovi (ex Huang et al. 2023) TaxID=2976432 RepID=A0ABT2I899_9SPHN|nr:phospholipase D-like domain-containing protein [Novosphingobium mangrovi (ex Huang et al. 2023)]MCT2400999.1 phospholipase D-like domain-containing protein [Novosphingobium mangrovi (ex Huang et al. 2023)]
MNEVSANGAEGDVEVPASVWRYAMARRAHLAIDAEDYFGIIREAMDLARQRIFLIGWDFDSRILLPYGRRWWQRGRRKRFPARLGSYILWLVKRNERLEVLLLKWNFAMVKYLFRGTMLFDLVRWALRRRIDFKFDSAHPVGCSHHQKIVVIDDAFAACGGIDMTSDRWDTPQHLPHDPRRRHPTGRPYGPWHDVTMVMEGDVAVSLGELGRERWRVAGGRRLAPCAPQEASAWPEDLDADFEDVEIGIARTSARYGDTPQVCEIEHLFIEQIRRARRFVYIETQYFASRAIAEVICERLLEQDPPEFLIVNPLTAQGWLEQAAMDTARVELIETLQHADHAGRFRIYHPLAIDGTPIYVHSKLMIVDDEILRVGSANMNNRSMGLDSECDVFIDTARAANAHAGPGITRLRLRLLAEHCGVTTETVASGIARHGSLAAMIDSLSVSGRRLEPLPLKHLSEAERALGTSGVLDPERPGEMFEPIETRGLFRRKGQLMRMRLMQRLRRRKKG